MSYDTYTEETGRPSPNKQPDPLQKEEVPPQELERMRRASIEAMPECYQTEKDGMDFLEGFKNGAAYEYLRFHQPVKQLAEGDGRIGWVKASERFPENIEVGKPIIIRPVKEGFDFYMFIKYVRDWDKKDKSYRWNLWDGFHSWTKKISPELLSKIEWLEESPNT